MKTFVYIFLVFCIITIPVLSFSQKEGIDTLATISSFEAVGEFYSMDYSGDYSELLDWMDDQMTGGKFTFSFDPFECSLFSGNGDEDYQIFGRNFDNQNNDVLISRYSSPDGYSSLAFTRMTDMGFSVGTNYGNLTFNQKLPLLLSAYFVPDGINEYGLAAGLASVDPVQVTVDPTKDTIFVTRLIREILDHAQTAEEALEIANSYNVFDNNVNTISHHILVGTPEGESLALEYHNGEFRAVEPIQNWQVLTNIPVYNVPHEQLMSGCWRYNSLYTNLEENEGLLSWDEGMLALEAVHLNCPWSAIYDMTNRGIYIAVHNNYENIAFVNIDEFEFLLYVNIPEESVKMNKGGVFIYPNPFSVSTTINYIVTEKSHVELAIFDSMGRKVKMLINEEKQAGDYSVTWKTIDDQGSKNQPGLYFCRINYVDYTQTVRLLLVE